MNIIERGRGVAALFMGENNTLNNEIQTEVCNDMTVENGFDALALSPELRKAVEAMGYTEPTDIQRQAIPLLRSGADIIGRSQTGTGKTMAFAIPAVEMIDREEA